MRALLLTVALTVFASAYAVADHPGGETPRFWADGNSATSQRIEQILDGPLTNLGIEFHDTPLEEIVAFLQDEYDLEIQFDNRALDDLGESTDVAITLNVRNVTLRSALKLMLRDLDLCFVAEDEYLLITSIDEASSRLRTAVYPVGDLTERYGVDNLVDAIISCSVDTFAVNGGSGEVVPLGDENLVITVDSITHDKVAGVLQAMRAADEFCEGAHSGHDEDEYGDELPDLDPELSHDHDDDVDVDEMDEADLDPFSDFDDDDSDDNPFGF